MSDRNKLLINEDEDQLSERICLNIIAVRKANSKRITTVTVVILLGWSVGFGKIRSADAIGLTMPLTPVVRLQPSYEHSVHSLKAKIDVRKNNWIVFESNEKMLYLLYLTDPRVSSNEEVLRIVKELRGGSWMGILGT